jgi:dihydrodipicolinate synthase/N-acetylneuraminate lyase
VLCDADDRRRVISVARRTLDDAGYKDVVIIAGTGSESRRETLKFTTIAKEAGAAFALVISPHYWTFAMTKPVLAEFYTTLADKADLPILI